MWLPDKSVRPRHCKRSASGLTLDASLPRSEKSATHYGTRLEASPWLDKTSLERLIIIEHQQAEFPWCVADFSLRELVPVEARPESLRSKWQAGEWFFSPVSHVVQVVCRFVILSTKYFIVESKFSSLETRRVFLPKRHKARSSGV